MPDDDVYLIWSVEHDAWWRPGRQGYTHDIREAGRYTHREAMIICASAIPGTARKIGILPELPVRLTDLSLMRDLIDEQWRDRHLLG
jgi:hypothetical protein